MKCFYRERGNKKWNRGHMTSDRAGRDVLFHNEEFKEALALNSVEILISVTETMYITGYNHVRDEDCYELLSFEVSPGWRKPRE